MIILTLYARQRPPYQTIDFIFPHFRNAFSRVRQRGRNDREKNVINIVLSRFKNKRYFILATIQIGLSQPNTIFFSSGDGKQKQQYCLFVCILMLCVFRRLHCDLLVTTIFFM